MELDLSAGYGRLDNILYQDGVQIVKFTHSKFPDWDELSIDGVKYMQKYINMYKDNSWFDILPGYYTIYPTQQQVLDSIPFEAKEKDATDFKLIKQNPVEFVKFIEQETDIIPSLFHEEYVDKVMSGEEYIINSRQVERVHNEKYDELMNLNQSIDQESHDPNSSRLDQVRFWFNKGFKTASEIAVKIDANPSYVQRLVKQVKDEKDNNKSQT